jgi:hypothetical protein
MLSHYETFDPSLMALADAVEDAKLSSLVSDTQGRYTEPKRS